MKPLNNSLQKKTYNMRFLSFGHHANSGRNHGLISVPRRGIKVKRLYRFIDTKRRKFPKTRIAILLKNIYDPNRSAEITLVRYLRGFLTYFLECEYTITQKSTFNLYAPQNNKEKGWSHFLGNIPLGTIIYSIETIPGSGAKLIRSAGTSALLLKKEHKLGGRCVIKLKSGEQRFISNKAIASVGIVGNHRHFLRNFAKAGTTRLYGRRPRVRPSAMNPVDHPMGGRTKGGCAPKNKTGKLSHGPTTAKKKPHNLILVTARKSRKQRIS